MFKKLKTNFLGNRTIEVTGRFENDLKRISRNKKTDEIKNSIDGFNG